MTGASTERPFYPQPALQVPLGTRARRIEPELPVWPRLRVTQGLRALWAPR